MQQLLRLLKPLLRQPVFQLLTSKALAAVLLGLIGALLVVAALFPQGQTAEFYAARYGRDTYASMNVMGVFDVTSSWIFWLLMVALAINLAAAMLDRLAKGLLQEVVALRRADFERMLLGTEILRLPEPPPRAVETLRRQLQERGFRLYQLSGDESHDRQIYATRGLPSAVPSTLAHAGILLLIAGLFIGQLFGAAGVATLAPGKQAPLPALGDDVRLGVDQLLTHYRLQAPLPYPSDPVGRLLAPFAGVPGAERQAPAAYVPADQEAYLAIFRGAERVGQKRVSAGQPLRYQGVSVYVIQVASNAQLRVAYPGRKGVAAKSLRVAEGDTFILPDLGYARLDEVVSGVLLKPGEPPELMQPFALLSLWSADRDPSSTKNEPPDQVLRLPLKKPLAAGPARLTLTDYSQTVMVRYSSDPGFPLAVLGGALAVAAFALRLWFTFYRIHWYLERLDEGSHLLVAVNEDGAFADAETLVRELAGKR